MPASDEAREMLIGRESVSVFGNPTVRVRYRSSYRNAIDGAFVWLAWASGAALVVSNQSWCSSSVARGM